MYDPILDALRRGAVAEALTAADALVAERPDDPQALRWLSTSQMQAGQPECWCAALPPLLAVPSAGAGSCYCPACLARMIETQQGGQRG